jgi:hypothetical protein
VNIRRLLSFEVLIVAIAIAARLVPGPRTIDDAYITFRYSQNLLDGEGLVYNPGERVLGTTTPVYALLMAGIALLQGGSQADFPFLAVLVNALADASTCLLLAALGTRLGSRFAGRAASAVWAIAPWSVTFAIGGLETSLLVALATATFYNHLAGRPAAAAATGGIALLTRPDALLFLGPMALARLWQIRQTGIDRRSAARELLAFGAPLGLWLIASVSFYQSPIPQSIFAKAAAYRLPPEAGLIRLLQHYATPFLGHLALGTWWIAVGLVLYPALFLLGVAGAFRTARATWPLLLYPWIYFIAYAVANPLLFRWYLTPPLPAYFLGIFLGLARISRDLNRSLPSMMIAGLVVLSTANGWTRHPDHGPDRPAPRMAFIELELLYERVGRSLAPEIRNDQVLAAGDIGALGYYSRARVFDLLGLVSPAATEFYPAPESIYAINFAVPPELVRQIQPDYMVVLEAYVRLGVLEDQDLLTKYDLVRTVPTEIYGSQGMLIFRRINPE